MTSRRTRLSVARSRGGCDYEWSLDRDALLAKVRVELADATDADVDVWTESGALASRLIDGERLWFRREPRNLFLHDDPARMRRLAAGRPADVADRHATTSRIVPHLIKAVAAADAAPESRRVLPIRTSYVYVLTVKPDRPGIVKGSRARAWLPFPQVHRQQQNVSLIATLPVKHAVSPASTPQRSVYLEQAIVDSSRPIRFEVSAEFETSARIPRPATPSKHDVPTPADLAERRPHLAFTDDVRRIVAELSHDGPDHSTLAKRLWNWVDDHVPWCAEHEYCLLPSLVEHGLRHRRGDCGVESIVFISLCRCAGIPARWLSGWTGEPTEGGGMHDWSEIWLDALGGWVPVDASYGKKANDDPRVRDFYFGGVDAYRMIVNTDFGRPLVPPVAGLRAEPLDFQRGEVEIDGRVLYFDEWDYSIVFEHEPIRFAEKPPRR